VSDNRQRWLFPLTPVELRQLWTYSDGDLTIKGYPFPGDDARAGNWALVDPATGKVQDLAPPGEFSRRFHPVDVFSDVPGLPNYLGTVSAPDGTALVDLMLDRNPFMLANGPHRLARPHALIVPRSHRDGWSSATARELAACDTAMILITDWYRSEAYYASGSWRATWRGEGGGVLINQCLHQLDMLQWLLGLPARVHSFVQLGRYHEIEVEDNVTAYMEFPNAATGVFIASTGEAPGTNRLEISGTMGKLLLENDSLTFFRNKVSMIDTLRTAKLGFQKPDMEKITIPFPMVT